MVAEGTGTSNDWRAWQLVDSAFPTGAFAHSQGLESAWQHGELANRDDLLRFARSAVWQAAYGVIPLVNAAYHAPERLSELDALADAFLTNSVANRASRVQGRTLVATACRVWSAPELTVLAARVPGLAAHVAPITGVVFQALGVPLATAQPLVLFGAARSVLSAAVRLGLIGSYDAQALQSQAAVWAERALQAVKDVDEDALAQTAPVIDILQGAHDRLYSRLFQS